MYQRVVARYPRNGRLLACYGRFLVGGEHADGGLVDAWGKVGRARFVRRKRVLGGQVDACQASHGSAEQATEAIQGWPSWQQAGLQGDAYAQEPCLPVHPVMLMLLCRRSAVPTCPVRSGSMLRPCVRWATGQTRRLLFWQRYMTYGVYGRLGAVLHSKVLELVHAATCELLPCAGPSWRPGRPGPRPHRSRGRRGFAPRGPPPPRGDARDALAPARMSGS